MAKDILSRVPMVGGVAYRERLKALTGTFTVTLAIEPDNRYFLHAIAVMANGEKIGYVAPEVAVQYDALKAATEPVTCPARRSAPIDRETSGVEVLLDFTALPLAPAA
jgi:hypothetical protein